MTLKGSVQSDERSQQFVDTIRDYGHVVMIVFDAVEKPTDEQAFAYSTGALESYAAPEIVVSGLGRELMKSMIDNFMDRWRAGERLELGVPLAGFLQDYDVICIDAASEKAINDYAIWADWYYERQPFPIWQMVWPGAHSGKFPWEDREVAALQECVTGAPWADVGRALGQPQSG